MDKTTLRKKMLLKRKELSEGEVVERSNTLVKIISDKVDLSGIERLHCFLPIVGSNEPDMRQFIKRAEEFGVKIFTTAPNVAVGGAGSAIGNYSLDSDVQFDLIIVPMLAYDPVTKHRLGFGGGFYDRMLAGQNNCKSIGVCFKEFAIENLPTEPTDIALDQIITA